MKTREDLITNGILKPHNMDTYLFASSKYGTQPISGKMINIKTAYNNRTANPRPNIKKIIDWFIENERRDILLIEHNLTSEQWIEVFKEYFKANSNIAPIQGYTTFTSSKHGFQTIGLKMRALKQAYNNGKGKLTKHEQEIIDWFKSTGREDMLTLKKYKKNETVDGDDDQSM